MIVNQIMNSSSKTPKRFKDEQTSMSLFLWASRCAGFIYVFVRLQEGGGEGVGGREIYIPVVCDCLLSSNKLPVTSLICKLQMCVYRHA